jgi:hypothetical protein
MKTRLIWSGVAGAAVIVVLLLWQVLLPSDAERERRAAASSEKTAPEILWQRTYGGSSVDAARGLVALPDGFAIAARSRTGEGKIERAWLVRTDAAGKLLWEKGFPGDPHGWATAMVAVPKGGFLIAGATGRKDMSKVAARLIRVDAKGAALWDKKYGGVRADSFTGAIAMPDGGAVVVGSTSSKGAGGFDLWIARIDPQGTLLWDKAFGGPGEDAGYAIARHPAGGFVVAGVTAGPDGSGSGSAWILRFIDDGKALWSKTFGGSAYDHASAVTVYPNGDVVFGGFSESRGTGWVMRLASADGKPLWDRALRGVRFGAVNDLVILPDGGIAVAGLRQTAKYSDEKGFLLRMAGDGQVLWRKDLDGTRDDNAIRLAWLPDGGFAVAGFTSTQGVGGDVWLVRLGYRK